MPNVRISDLPDAIIPMDLTGTFFEVQTVESGVEVSRKVSGDQLTFTSGFEVEGTSLDDPAIGGGVFNGTLDWQNANNERTGVLGFEPAGDEFVIQNLAEGGEISLRVRDGTVHLLTADYGVTIPTTGAIRVPVGTTAEEPAALNGQIRYDSDNNVFRGVVSGVWADLDTGLTFPIVALDNDEIRWGTGNDVQQFFDGTDLRFDAVDGVDIRFIGGTAGAETMLSLISNGAMEASFDGAVKLATTADGADVNNAGAALFDVIGTGLNLDATLGTRADSGGIAWLWDESVTTGKIRQTDAAGVLQDNFITMVINGAVALFHNGTNMAQTQLAASGGLLVNNLATGAGFERVLTTADIFGGALNDLTDVTLTAPATGSVLFKSAGNWLNTPAITIDPAAAVRFFFNTNPAAATKAEGWQIIGELDNDPAVFSAVQDTSLSFTNLSGEQNFVMEFKDSDDFSIENTTWDGRIFLGATTAAGVLVTGMVIVDPDIGVTLSTDGTTASLATGISGVTIRSAAAQNLSQITIQRDGPVGVAVLRHSASGNQFDIATQEDDDVIRLTGEVIAGTQVMLVADPLAGVDLYHAGGISVSAQAESIFSIPSTALNGGLTIRNTANNAAVGHLKFDGSSVLEIENNINSGNIILTAKTSGAVLRTMIELDANNDLTLSHADGAAIFNSLPAASGGAEVNNTLSGGGFEQVATITTGSFTGTLTGFAADPTPTVQFIKIDNRVTLYITADAIATSDAITMTMTGVPAALQPTNDKDHITRGVDNSSNRLLAALLTGGGGVITFSLFNTSALFANNIFTASANKGLLEGWSMSYILD